MQIRLGVGTARVLAVLLLCIASGQVFAQGGIRGSVSNELGAPLADALVVLDLDGTSVRTRTGLDGVFRFDRVGTGPHTLRALRIGYRSRDTVVTVGAQRIEISIVLTRLPSILDTVNVLTTSTGIRGIVVSRVENRPVSDAAVSIPSTQLRARTAPNGTFEFPDVREGAHVLYAKADGFLPRMMAVQVPSAGGVSVVVDVQRMGTVGTKRLAQPMAEFDTRVRFAVSANSALIPRQELLGHESESIAEALHWSISFLRKGLVLGRPSCIYVDGVLSRTVTLDTYSVSDIEAIEVYGAKADWTGTLAQRSMGFGCSETASTPPAGSRRSRGAPSALVVAVVLWLRHSS